MWPLTVAWYADRLDPDFKPRPPHDYQQVLSSVGLHGDFWQLG